MPVELLALPSSNNGTAPDTAHHQVANVSSDTRVSEPSKRGRDNDGERCGVEDDGDGGGIPILCNGYLDSLELLEKNKVVIDRLTEQLSVFESGTSSIVSGLDAIETKISPILSKHVVESYQSCLSYADNNDDDKQTTDTVATSPCSLSKTRTPDQNGAMHGEAARLVEHHHDNLSDFDCEWFRDDVESVSGLFPSCSDLSSITKCQSVEQVSVNHDTRDEVEVVIKSRRLYPAPESYMEDVLQERDCDDSYVVSTDFNNLSIMSGLSDAANEEENHEESNAVVSKVNSTDPAALQTVMLTSEDSYTQIYEKTGQKSHLFGFPEDLCCLLNEPSLDLTIPATADAEDNDDDPCFPLGRMKNRNKDEDECACVIC